MMRRWLTGSLLLCALPVYAVGAAGVAGDVSAGQRVFQRCADCHQTGSSARNGFGPSLHGVVGRQAGSLLGYAYSPAMRQSGLQWNEANLRAFLHAPDTVVPGTRMRFWGLSDDAHLTDLIAYLRAN